jgi:PAS domain-containing protein
VAHERTFQRISDGLIVVDGTGEIVDVNAAGRRTFDPTPTEGAHIETVLPEADLSGLDGRTVTATIDGTGRTYDCHVTPFYDHHDRLTGRGVVFGDLTVILGRADELEGVVGDEAEAGEGSFVTLSLRRADDGGDDPTDWDATGTEAARSSTTPR